MDIARTAKPRMARAKLAWAPAPYCQWDFPCNSSGTDKGSPYQEGRMSGGSSQDSENPVAEYGAALSTIGPESFCGGRLF